MSYFITIDVLNRVQLIAYIKWYFDTISDLIKL